MPGETDNEGQVSAHPIEEMAKLSSCQLEVLKSKWITTTEALVAAAATQQGRNGLCQALDMERPELERLLEYARDILGPNHYRKLMDAKPGGPIGALLDEMDHRGTAEGSAEGDEAR